MHFLTASLAYGMYDSEYLERREKNQPRWMIMKMIDKNDNVDDDDKDDDDEKKRISRCGGGSG